MRTERRAISIDEKHKILQKSNYTCCHCGKKIDIHDMTVEHIIPLSKGGTYDDLNMVGLCQDCNYEKSNGFVPFNFYKYINKELREKHRDYFYEKIRTSKIERDRHKKLENISFELNKNSFRAITPSVLNFIQKQSYNEKNFLQVLKMGLSVSPLYCIHKAFPAEADDIFNFIEKNLKCSDMNMCLYTNEYEILGAIEDGEVYIVRKSNDEIGGVIAFESISKIQRDIIKPIGLYDEFLYRNTGLYVNWINTCRVVSKQLLNERLPFSYSGISTLNYIILGEYLKNDSIIVSFYKGLLQDNYAEMRKSVEKQFGKRDENLILVNKKGVYYESELEKILANNNINDIIYIIEDIKGNYYDLLMHGVSWWKGMVESLLLYAVKGNNRFLRYKKPDSKKYRDGTAEAQIAKRIQADIDFADYDVTHILNKECNIDLKIYEIVNYLIADYKDYGYDDEKLEVLRQIKNDIKLCDFDVLANE